MTGWIDTLINLLSGGLPAFARGVIDRFHSLWATITGLGTRVQAAWNHVVGTVRRWATAQARHALATVNALRQLVTVTIPHKIAAALSSVKTWTANLVTSAIGAAKAFLIGLLTATRNYLLGLLNGVRDTVAGVLSWIDSARARLARIEDRVFGVLSSPDRLVAWILTPLVGALAHWALDNGARLVRLAWRGRRNLEHATLLIIEDIIHSLL